MQLPFWRPLRLVLLALVLFALFNLLTFWRNQSRFQKFLETQYITWDDFPTEYSDVLRTHKEENLLPDTYDYAKSFPPAGANSASERIPPIIHFIWFQNLYETRPEVTKIPSKGSDAPDLCTKYNPDWEIKVWNATAGRELIEKHYPWFISTYDAYKYPIQRIDALKYIVLWHYGGVYMDMDIACRRPLEPLLQFPAWFPEASPLGVNNDLMATRAKHPVIMFMLRNLKSRDKNLIFPYLTIFWSTGPQFTSDLLKQWFLGHPAPTYTKGASKANSGKFPSQKGPLRLLIPCFRSRRVVCVATGFLL
jgi:mannosyltransferase OCH1-like enzyme